MIQNWFTLYHYARELNQYLSGRIIKECYTSIPRELRILLSGNDNQHIFFSASPPLLTLWLDQTTIPRKRVKVFKELEGKTIKNVYVQQNDRCLIIEFTDIFCVFLIFGNSGNVQLFSKNGIEINKFLKSHVSLDKFHPNPATEITPAIHPDKDIRFQGILKKEFQHRIKNNIGIHKKSEVYQQLIQELDQATPKIYPTSLPIFSITDLHIVKEKPVSYLDFISSIKEFRKKQLLSIEFQKNKRGLRRAVIQQLEHTRRRIYQQKKKMEKMENPEVFRKKGDILLIHQTSIKKGGKYIQLPDHETGEIINIDLDPSKNVFKNAQEYYTRAKKMESGSQQLQQTINEGEKDEKLLSELLTELERIETVDQLKEFEKSIKESGVHLLSEKHGKGHITSLPYREYVLSDKYRLWVGKSSRDNDKLTFHCAHKEELWFHVQGSVGSHVILKTDNPKINPPKNIIEIAASAAAYYSKARTSKLVPVIYTKRKYVTKPKGSSPGMVHVQYEKSILVEPLLPEKKTG
jgi:predicted ribosome quality control (RQC) complex YloA/Tae2 family protein